jgi:hypothetical protein
MAIRLSRHLILTAVVTAVGSAFGAAITWADPPGHPYVTVTNDQALVVQRPHDRVPARILKQPIKLPDDVAASIAAGAKPVGDDVILVYRGQLYILPDREINGHLATQMVLDAAGAPKHSQ